MYMKDRELNYGLVVFEIFLHIEQCILFLMPILEMELLVLEVQQFPQLFFCGL